MIFRKVIRIITPYKISYGRTTDDRFAQLLATATLSITAYACLLRIAPVPHPYVVEFIGTCPVFFI